MSKLKDALESAISTLQRETPRIQNILEAWDSFDPDNSFERDELDLLREKYENGTLLKEALNELAVCEENDEEIVRLEDDQEYGDEFREAASTFKAYVDQLPAKVSGLESRASEHEGTGLFGENYKAYDVPFALIDGSLPYPNQINSMLRRAHEHEANDARSPEKLLQSMTESSYEEPDDTRLFCRLFDFKAELDDFEVYEIVPSDDDEIPQYIGGEFSSDEYDRSQPENFVWVAFNQLGELCEEYNEEHNEIADNYDVFDDIDDTEEIIELKERIKQQARPIMNGVIDETHDKYGEYRDRVIASVRNKQDEYDLSDDVVSAFANHVTKRINALIKNVENEFSEENQFYNEDEWGVLRVY